MSLVYGVGINDAGYQVNKLNSDGKQVMCPFYSRWKSMLERAYSSRIRRIRPTYIGCSSVKEWRVFSNFKRWMELQDWKGKHLDKDIMYPGNKIYGPDTCVFISSDLNVMLNSNEKIRGDYPQGVSRIMDCHNRYLAKISIFGEQTIIGRFDSADKAAQAYSEYKRLHILKIACCDPDIRVKQGLYRHSEMLK